MVGRTTNSDRDVGHLVERQMRNWELSRAQKERGPARPLDREVEHFVSISRAVGLPGHELVTKLHEALRWPMFDRVILQAMAGEDRYRQQVFRQLDQHDVGWVEELLRSMSQGRFSKEDYFHRLSETVLALARRGHAIFLGRATDLILPRNVGLRVRVTASRDFCIKGYARQRGMAYEAAVRQVEEIEHERARYLRNLFGMEVSEQTRHDLIVNMECFDVDQTVAVILSALKIRGIVA